MNKEIFDILIIGAGVSGVSCAIEAKVKNIDNILVLEKSDNFFDTVRKFYKDGKRVDRNWKNHIVDIIGNIDFFDSTKDDTLKYFENLLEKHNINPLYNSEVEKVIKNSENIFEVYSKTQKFLAKNVIITIGKMGKPNKPDYKIPLEIQKIVNFNLDSCTKNENILVIGGGNSAAEYAYSLIDDKNSVTLAYRQKSFSKINETNENILKEYEKTKALNIKLACNILSLEACETKVKVYFSNEESSVFDRLIYAIGGTTPTDFLKNCGIQIDEHHKAIFDENFETNVKGLFLAGDLAAHNEGSIAIALNHGFKIIDYISKR
ncbi:NAD(P)-binding domain-containing protein [Aliarcobacter vitoriensis]|uniref:NAD(P)-binding domain-containing protein n=1 Tax=Aliarcobacter vitoriensis TaxID=2011099 RepID=UPI003AAC227A